MNLLSIGGSDPSSGAGVQGDVRLFAGTGISCLSVVTAVTAQNTSSFGSVEPVPPRMIKDQLDAVLSDFEIGAVKVGMTYTAQATRLVAREVGRLRAPVVADPVIKSTTGGMLIERAALADYRRHMVPAADVITPNAFEAGVLAGTRGAPPEEAAAGILGMGARCVIVTGIRRGADRIGDMVFEGGTEYLVSGRRLPGESHGGGCAYSSLLAAELGGGRTLKESARAARDGAAGAIRAARRTGRGIPVTGDPDPLRGELGEGIRGFAAIRGVHRLVPECQTNFVFSGEAPRSAADVMGVAGRIVRAGRGVVVAGGLEYGGSKHVAAALLAAARRFPGTRSAVNVRYRPGTVRAMRRAGMAVASYDRGSEPAGVKSRGSSVGWGVGAATRGLKECPDAVFHEGDVGKEPMMVVFGTSPADVVAKVSRIARGAALT